MPHFDTDTGQETWLCQGCASVFPASETSLWVEGTGSMCLQCCAEAADPKHDEPTKLDNPNIITHNGTFTVKSLKSGEHRTFSVKTQASDARFAPGKRVLALLSGPDNTSDYVGFAFIIGDTVEVWKKFKGTKYDEYSQFLQDLSKGEAYAIAKCEVYAATRCRVCNRKLTTPESVVSGIGPICAGK